MNNAPALREEHHRDMTIPAPVTDPTGGRLVAWAEGLAAAHRIASALCVTTFAPQHFRGKPEEAAAAILYGDEIGFTPTQSLQNLYVISGKPALYARAMVALVQAAGHAVWTESKTDDAVTVKGRRKGTEQVITETWDIKRAQRAGYTNNKKYQTDPQAMLYARAASDVCRQVAADVLAGIGYSVEEMQLVETSATPAAKPQGMAGLRAAVQPEQPAEPVEYPQAETGEAPSEAQRKRMFALFAETDLPDGRTTEGRETRLAYCSDVVGREVTTSNDLTAADVSAVIDALERDQQQEDPSAPWPAQEALPTEGGDQ